MLEWLRMAAMRDIVWRSAKVALVVGSLLALINHGDKLLGHGLAPGDLAKIALTYAVPYGVATWSAVQTILADAA